MFNSLIHSYMAVDYTITIIYIYYKKKKIFFRLCTSYFKAVVSRDFTHVKFKELLLIKQNFCRSDN